MNVNKVILTAVTTGVLATGLFVAVPHEKADAAVKSQGLDTSKYDYLIKK
ncbi:hypothetical protein [Staphylococcus chromogenes]